jgi:hypothetical protein
VQLLLVFSGLVAAALPLLMPLKAILLNILSLSATFGGLVWIFQDGHLQNLLGFTSTGSIDATQPILFFAIAQYRCARQPLHARRSRKHER